MAETNVTLKLSRIDSGVETTLWQGVNPLNPVFLRTGWQTQFNANVIPAEPPVVDPPVVVPPVEPPVVEPPVEPEPEPIPPVEPPVVEPPVVQPPAQYVINIVGGSLPQPKTGAELQALADAAAAGRFVQVLAPGTKVTLDRTIIFKQAQHDGSVWGMDLNWAQLDWAGPALGDMIRCEGVTGAANRAFVLTNGQLYGGGWWQDRGRANQAGACLRISAKGGDPMAYYKPTLQNLYASYAQYGFVFEGAVFEFSHINLHAENMTKDGMLAVSAGGAIMSNVFGIAPNMSRNGGSGINTGYSHNVIMGSFIQNSQFGINAPDGLRVAAFNNGENTGESLIRLGYDGYGSVIFGNEMSTGAVSVNNEGAPSTGHSRFILDVPPGLTPTLPNNNESATDRMFNHVASYGGGDALVKRVRK
jgi:hypothetical protein